MTNSCLDEYHELIIEWFIEKNADFQKILRALFLYSQFTYLIDLTVCPKANRLSTWTSLLDPVFTVPAWATQFLKMFDALILTSVLVSPFSFTLVDKPS